MARIKSVFLHCSDSTWGDAMVIDAWHRRRGWPCIGYHFVVLNGQVTSDTRWQSLNGMIEPGHVIDQDLFMEPNEIGYHVAGRNHDSLGVCLIGTTEFTPAQLLASHELMHELLKTYQLTPDDVLGHYEHPGAGKTCPNIPMQVYREFLRDKATLNQLMDGIRARNAY